MKPAITPPPQGAYRLTLSKEAITLAVARKARPILGVAKRLRTDGKVDVAVKMSTVNLLKQLAMPGENLSDTVIRVLKKGQSQCGS